MPKMLTVTEAAEILRLEPSTLIKWARAGKFPLVNVSPGERPRYRVSMEALQRFIDGGSDPDPAGSDAP